MTVVDNSPRILLWNYSEEEVDHLNRFFCELDVPPAVKIEGDQGHLLVHEILFSGRQGGDLFISEEPVVLFFNVVADAVHTVMREMKKTDLAQPIFAMVTEQNIAWKFSDLVEHLVEERDYITRRRAEEREKHGPGRG